MGFSSDKNQIKFSEFCKLPLEKALSPKSSIQETYVTCDIPSYYSALDLNVFDAEARKRVREYRKSQKQKENKKTQAL